MKRSLAALAAAAATAAVALVPAQSFGATVSVRVGDNFFSPSSKTVNSGTKMVWRWVGRAPHNVVVTSGPSKFRSSTFSSGTYSRTVRARGLYRIVCTIHPGMRMSLRVR